MVNCKRHKMLLGCERTLIQVVIGLAHYLTSYAQHKPFFITENLTNLCFYCLSAIRFGFTDMCVEKYYAGSWVMWKEIYVLLKGKY